VGTEQFHLPNILFHMAQTTPYVPRPIPGMRLRNLLLTDEYTYSFYHITGNHTVSVTFTAKTYELEFWFNSDGKIVDGSFKNINNGGKISVKSGESPSFTAIANPNYHILTMNKPLTRILLTI